MAIFGWIVLFLFGLYITFGGLFVCIFGGLDLSVAPKRIWAGWVVISVTIWWLLIKTAPFSITVSGG